MDSKVIIEKFGDNYIADELTYKMGIDHRFTKDIAERFKNRMVLETCTGAGFSTISLARVAKFVITFEIDENHQFQAKKNLEKAGLTENVILKLGNILDEKLINELPPIEAAFLDPDWAVTGPNHIFKFKKSNTKPPADILFEKVFEITENIALILPPLIDLSELKALPEYELQRLYLDESHELYCIYFGELAQSAGETELRIII